jgi:hypothetical protein
MDSTGQHLWKEAEPVIQARPLFADLVTGMATWMPPRDFEHILGHGCAN